MCLTLSGLYASIGVVTELQSIYWVIGLITCARPPWTLRNFPLRCLPWHLACLNVSDACEIRGEKSPLAKDNPWANSAESKQGQAESVPLHASCLAMLMPKVSRLFLLKKPPNQQSFQLDPLRKYLFSLYLPNWYC